MAEPFTPPGLGMEFTHHYAEVRPVEAYADHRILHHRQAELGLRARDRAAAVGAPDRPHVAVPGRLSVETKTLVGVRARYVQPYEDHVLGGGVNVLDAAVDRIERADDGRLTAYLRRTDGGADLAIEVDDAISATGFVCPLAGPAGPRCRDVRGEPAARPDAVVGERQRARDLLRGDDRAGREGPPEARRAGQLRGRPRRPLQRPRAGRARSPRRTSGSGPTAHLAPDDVAGFIAAELAEAPELFHQRGYLARVLTADPAGGMRDEGVQPLAHVLDAGGPDAIAATLEGDGSGAIYPVVYTPDRRQGRRSRRSSRIR